MRSKNVLILVSTGLLAGAVIVFALFSNRPGFSAKDGDHKRPDETVLSGGEEVTDPDGGKSVDSYHDFNVSGTSVDLADYAHPDEGIFSFDGDIPEFDRDETLKGLESVDSYQEIDPRPIEDGDPVQISFTGEFNGEALSQENILIFAGQSGGHRNQVYIDFDSQLIGHVPGDTFEFSAEIGDDFPGEPEGVMEIVRPNTTTHGSLNVSVTVLAVLEGHVPEVTDAYIAARQDTDATTIEEYLQEKEAEWYAGWDAAVRNTYTRQAWDWILENTSVKKYPKKKLEQIKAWLEDENVPENELDEEAEEMAKPVLIAEQIAEQEQIAFPIDTYEERLLAYPDLTEDLKQSVYDQVLIESVRDWLGDHAVPDPSAE